VELPAPCTAAKTDERLLAGVVLRSRLAVKSVIALREIPQKGSSVVE
jgi:hypothetical protein